MIYRGVDENIEYQNKTINTHEATEARRKEKNKNFVRFVPLGEIPQAIPPKSRYNYQCRSRKREVPMADFPTRNYSKDDVIFEEGSVATVAYILKRGSVEIFVTRKGNKTVLAVLKPGAIFGEMALVLENRQRTATARVLEDSEVIVIFKNSFYEYLNETSIVIRTLISELIDRLYKTTARLVESDELSLGICQMLRLLNLHQVSLLDYGEVVRAFSRCFKADPAVIEEKLEQLARTNLLEFETMPSGKKGIKVKHNITYIDGEKGD